MRKAFLLLLTSILVSGCCVQSLNVFYTDNSITDVPELMGDWASQIQLGESVTNKQITFWTFGTNTVDTYDGDNTYSELEVVYFKLGNTYFMDFTAGWPMKGKKSFGNTYWGVGITLVHSLCKIDINDNTLTLIPLNLDWFEDRINNNTLKLPYIKATHEDSSYIFTATPNEWDDFLNTHKDDETVFDPELKFVFKREKE